MSKSKNGCMGCAGIVAVVMVGLYIIGIIKGGDEDDKATYTCNFCRKIFIEEHDGLQIWKTDAANECMPSFVHGGDHIGYCTRLHCEMSK